MLKLFFKLFLIQSLFTLSVFAQKPVKEVTKTYRIECRVFVHGDQTEANAVGKIFVSITVNTKTDKIKCVEYVSNSNFNLKRYIITKSVAKVNKKGNVYLQTGVIHSTGKDPFIFDAEFSYTKNGLSILFHKIPGEGGIFVYAIHDTAETRPPIRY